MMFVAVTGRADVTSFFNTQMVLDLNGEWIECTFVRIALSHLNITEGDLGIPELYNYVFVPRPRPDLGSTPVRHVHVSETIRNGIPQHGIALVRYWGGDEGGGDTETKRLN